MNLAWIQALKPDYILRNYRRIVFGLVLVNTALIVFLVVYIWTFGLESRSTRLLGRRSAAAQVSPGGLGQGTVVADRLVVWSAPGGAERGADSLAALGRGELVDILGSLEIDDALWVELELKEGKGWVPATGVRYIRMMK